MHLTLTLNPSRLRAAAHRRMAFSALRANSSAAVRIARYQYHMNKARALEATVMQGVLHG